MNMHSKVPASGESSIFEADAGFERQSRRWLLPALIGSVVLLLAATSWWFFGRTPPAPLAAPDLPLVSIVVPGTVMVPDTVRVTGSIAAKRDMPVGVQGSGGMVTAVLVDAGQYVRAGQVLARLDRAVMSQQVAELSANILQVQADLALAQAELERAQSLVAKGFISKADIDRKMAARDSARARVGIARATLSAMQVRLAQLDVRAPASGLVLSRNVEAGQIVGPSSPPLFRVAEDGVFEMRAQVAEQDMARLSVGQVAQLRSVGSAVDHQGKIWLLDPVIDMASRQGVARIAVAAAPDLRVGAFANATIAAGRATYPVLPQSAVLVDDNGSYVLVVGKDNVILHRAVTVGAITADGMSIATGLSGSERVVTTAAAFLRAGEKVDPIVTKSVSAR